MNSDAALDGAPAGHAGADRVTAIRSALATQSVIETSKRVTAPRVAIAEDDVWPPIRFYGWAQDERGHALYGRRSCR